MTQPHERLDAAMNLRRLELRMNWREVATTAGISYEALRATRRGDYRPTELTARRLDGALQWTHGSTLATLNGGTPTPIEGDAEQLPALTAELEVLRRLLAATIREMNLTPAEADEVWRRVRPEIEAAHRSVEGDSGGKPHSQRTG
ncbi:hypothetical protein ACWEFL_15955 [Streptomyces sp. NPDC004838]